MLTKEAILKADDLDITAVDVPSWGGQVYIRTMTGGERDGFEQAVSDANKAGKLDIRGLKVKLVVLTLCDENGARLFSESDTAALLAKSSKALNSLFIAAQKINGLTESDVEELAGNSEADLNA